MFMVSERDNPTAAASRRPLGWILAVGALALVAAGIAGCGSDEPAEGRVYDIRGTVKAVQLEKPAVTLDHEAIPGLMDAMEMPFDVADRTMLEGIVVGDRVTGELTVADGKQVITALKKQ